MAKRKRKRGKRGFTLPIAVVAGLAAGMTEAIGEVIKGDFQNALNFLATNYTGYNPSTQQFNIGSLQKGLLPLAIGLAVHKFVGGAPLNANRALAAAGVPFIRI